MKSPHYIATVNYYPHIDLSATGESWIVETEFIDHISGETFWKCYRASTRKAACTKAQAQGTRFINKLSRIYG